MRTHKLVLTVALLTFAAQDSMAMRGSILLGFTQTAEAKLGKRWRREVRRTSKRVQKELERVEDRIETTAKNIPRDLSSWACEALGPLQKNPLRGTPVPLTAWQREKLVGFFGSLPKAAIFYRANIKEPRFAGQTFRDKIYIKDGPKPTDHGQLSLIAHEYVHVMQGERNNALYRNCKAHYESSFEYHSNELEREAYAMQAKFAEYLSQSLAVSKAAPPAENSIAAAAAQPFLKVAILNRDPSGCTWVEGEAAARVDLSRGEEQASQETLLRVRNESMAAFILSLSGPGVPGTAPRQGRTLEEQRLSEGMLNTGLYGLKLRSCFVPVDAEVAAR